MDPISERAGTASRATVNRQINALLANQSDVVGYRQLAELGLSREAIRGRVRSSLLYRHWPDVYTGRPGRLSRKGEYWAAHFAAGPVGAISSVTAAEILDLGVARPRDGLHVVHLGSRRTNYPGLTFHETGWLPSRDVVSIDHLRCTAPARTLLDCAELVDADRLDDMLDRAVLLRTYDGNTIARVLAERPGARGAARLRAAVARLDHTAGAHRNRFERKATALIRESRLIAVPTVNTILEGFESDLSWVNTRAIIECDGRDYHRSPAQLAADARKEELLLELGYVILRLRWAQVVYEPARTLARIEQFVLANRVPPVRGVSGRVVF